MRANLLTRGQPEHLDGSQDVSQIDAEIPKRSFTLMRDSLSFQSTRNRITWFQYCTPKRNTGGTDLLLHMLLTMGSIRKRFTFVFKEIMTKYLTQVNTIGSILEVSKKINPDTLLPPVTFSSKSSFPRQNENHET